jgi:hypothetical protein
MTYISLALIKVLDNIIATAKSIATYKEQKILSSIFVIISQLIFYLVISQVISDSTVLAIVIVAVSSGVGNYLAFLLNDKFKKDVKYTMILTSSDVEDVKQFCTYLTEHNIKHIANDGYDRAMNRTIHIIAFSKTKDESRCIERYLRTTNSKYLKEVI